MDDLSCWWKSKARRVAGQNNETKLRRSFHSFPKGGQLSFPTMHVFETFIACLELGTIGKTGNMDKPSVRFGLLWHLHLQYRYHSDLFGHRRTCLDARAHIPQIVGCRQVAIYSPTEHTIHSGEEHQRKILSASEHSTRFGDSW